MRDIKRHLKRLLADITVSKIELSASLPFIKITFDRSDIESLLKSESLLSDVLSEHFVRRRVFWEDARAETAVYVEKSLSGAEAELNKTVKELSAKKDASHAIALAKPLRAWAAACALTRKDLVARMDEIQKEKDSVLGYDWANEDRQDALRECLVTLRTRIYPLVQGLSSLLDDDDPTKKDVLDKLTFGKGLIQNVAVIEGMSPDFQEL